MGGSDQRNRARRSLLPLCCRASQTHETWSVEKVRVGAPAVSVDDDDKSNFLMTVVEVAVSRSVFPGEFVSLAPLPLLQPDGLRLWLLISDVFRPPRTSVDSANDVSIVATMA